MIKITEIDDDIIFLMQLRISMPLNIIIIIFFPIKTAKNDKQLYEEIDTLNIFLQ